MPPANRTLKLQAPTGEIEEVPFDQVMHYLKLGAKQIPDPHADLHRQDTNIIGGMGSLLDSMTSPENVATLGGAALSSAVAKPTARAVGQGLVEAGSHPLAAGLVGFHEFMNGSPIKGFLATIAPSFLRRAGTTLTRWGGKTGPEVATEAIEATPPLATAAATRVPFDLKRLILSPEDAQRLTQLQQIAQQEASRQGMRYAAWGKGGQP